MFPFKVRKRSRHFIFYPVLQPPPPPHPLSLSVSPFSVPLLMPPSHPWDISKTTISVTCAQEPYNALTCRRERANARGSGRTLPAQTCACDKSVLSYAMHVCPHPSAENSHSDLVKKKQTSKQSFQYSHLVLQNHLKV